MLNARDSASVRIAPYVGRLIGEQDLQDKRTDCSTWKSVVLPVWSDLSGCVSHGGIEIAN